MASSLPLAAARLSAWASGAGGDALGFDLLRRQGLGRGRLGALSPLGLLQLGALGLAQAIVQGVGGGVGGAEAHGCLPGMGKRTVV